MSGFKSGPHRSPFLGSSTEFAEHREYSAGDDPRTLDWRVYGKQDRYCIKKYVDETNLRATFVLDCSASMAYRGEAAMVSDQLRLSKLDYAQRLIALVAHHLMQQGDAVGLILVDNQVRSCLPAACKPSHLRRLLAQLADHPPQHASQLPSVIHQLASRVPPRGLVILVSDFLEEVPPLQRALHHLRHRQHELILWHVLAEEELSFPFEDDINFRDLEGLLASVDVDPHSIRREYLQQFGSHMKQLETLARQLPADYVRFNTRLPYAEALANYFTSRQRR